MENEMNKFFYIEKFILSYMISRYFIKNCQSRKFNIIIKMSISNGKNYFLDNGIKIGNNKVLNKLNFTGILYFEFSYRLLE